MKKTRVIRIIVTVMLIVCMAFCVAACGKSGTSTEYFISYGVEGQGMVAGVSEGTSIDLSKSAHAGSFNNAHAGDTYVIEAREQDGSTAKFVKWTNNGKDYSTDRKITVKATEDMKLTAVFK